MKLRSCIGVLALAVSAALMGAVAARAQASHQTAFDPSKYPDWKGQWLRTGRGNGNAWDPTKPLGLGEQAPLIPEYQAMLEGAVRDEKAGGQGIDPTYLCVPSGLPRSMIVVLPIFLYPIGGLGLMQLAVGFLDQQNVVLVYGAEYLPNHRCGRPVINEGIRRVGCDQLHAKLLQVTEPRRDAVHVAYAVSV